jgi:glutamate synthase (NADPH/NADH) small chain
VDDYAQKELDFLLQIGGIEIRHGQRLGDNLSLSELHQQFDAVFLGLGLAASKQLGLPTKTPRPARRHRLHPRTAPGR